MTHRALASGLEGKGCGRACLDAFAAEHAVASAHDAVFAGNDRIQDFGVTQARLLAFVAPDAFLMIDVHIDQADLAYDLVETAKRADGATPYAMAPEQFGQDNRQEREPLQGSFPYIYQN